MAEDDTKPMTFAQLGQMGQLLKEDAKKADTAALIVFVHDGVASMSYNVRDRLELIQFAGMVLSMCEKVSTANKDYFAANRYSRLNERYKQLFEVASSEVPPIAERH